MYMLHGESDSLLPSRQSVRLCNGLSGDVDNGPVPNDINTVSVARSFDCDGRGSQLHLVAEGEHTLDLCISDELCAAGSPVSAAATAEAIENMLVWASSDSLQTLTRSQISSVAGVVNPALFFLLLGVCFFRVVSYLKFLRNAVLAQLR